MTISVLIVDDEPPARRHIRSLLQGRHITIVGEADNGKDATELIRSLRPDVALLDIELRGEHGIELARSWHGQVGIVFITAHPQHAVDAFGVDAIDYVLKPVQPARLLEALKRAHERGRSRAEPLPLALETSEGLRMVAAESILRLEAAGDYVEVFTTERKESWLCSSSLSHFTQEFQGLLLRVHRRHLVARAQISALTTSRDGRHIELADGTRLPVGRSYLESVKSELRLRCQASP